MQVELTNKRAIFAKIGSFWQTNTTPETAAKAAHLAEGMDLARLPHALGASAVRAVQEPEVESRRAWKFQALDVMRIGPDLSARVVETLGTSAGPLVVYRRPAEYDLGIPPHIALDILTSDDVAVAELWATEDCQYLLFPMLDVNTAYAPSLAELQNRWLVPCPHDVEPWAVEGTRVLIQGIDFIWQPGVMVFRQPPQELFPTRTITLLQGRALRQSIYRYPWHVDSPSPGTWVPYYFRENQSGWAFERAIAQASSLAVLPEAGELLDKKTFCCATWYQFPWGTIEVPYAHAELEVGTTYAAGDVVGGMVEVWGQHRGLNWWQDASMPWITAGLDVSQLSGFGTSLRAPNELVRVDAVESTGGKIHARIHWLNDDPTELSRYWYRVMQAEKASGFYLNDVIGLTTTADVKFVNGLELIFKYILGRRGLLIRLRTPNIGEKYHATAQEFAKAHAPLGSILLFQSV